MGSSAYDIEIGGKGYLLMPGGYLMSESPKSFPAKGSASTVEFNHPDNWSYFGQSDWVGEVNDDWLSDGPYLDGWGLDLSSKPGEIKIAKKLVVTQADAANTGGYVSFSDGTTRCWKMGKTNGTSYHSTDLVTWTSVALGAANYLTATNLPVGDAKIYKEKWHVGTAVGKLWSVAAGTTTWTDHGTPSGVTTPLHPLGSYKGKLWLGSLNKLWQWDGATFTEKFSGNIDGFSVVAVAGGSGLLFMTNGPESKLYMTDGNALHQLATVGSDFKPRAAVFLETLYIFGDANDEASKKGQVYRLEESGLVRTLEFGDETADYGIRSAILDKDRIIWGANQRTGIGVFDPTMDVFNEVKMGYYVNSVITSVAGIAHGITQFAGKYVIGIQGNGIYKQDVPGTYKVKSHRYDADSKNINKFWGFAEIRHSALVSGQTIVVKTTKDGTTLDTWGTSSTVGSTAPIIAAPASYKHPFIQYEMSGDANGSDLYIYDIAIAFIEASDNPKREWDIVVGIEGSQDRPQLLRDGTDNDRTAMTMFANLNSLWNTVTTYKDLDNTTYNVVMKMPRARADDFVKDVDVGNSLIELVVLYRIHLTQL